MTLSRRQRHPSVLRCSRSFLPAFTSSITPARRAPLLRTQSRRRHHHQAICEGTAGSLTQESNTGRSRSWVAYLAVVIQPSSAIRLTAVILIRNSSITVRLGP